MQDYPGESDQFYKDQVAAFIAMREEEENGVVVDLNVVGGKKYWFCKTQSTQARANFLFL